MRHMVFCASQVWYGSLANAILRRVRFELRAPWTMKSLPAFEGYSLSFTAVCVCFVIAGGAEGAICYSYHIIR